MIDRLSSDSTHGLNACYRVLHITKAVPSLQLYAIETFRSDRVNSNLRICNRRNVSRGLAISSHKRARQGNGPCIDVICLPAQYYITGCGPVERLYLDIWNPYHCRAHTLPFFFILVYPFVARRALAIFTARRSHSHPVYTSPAAEVPSARLFLKFVVPYRQTARPAMDAVV